MEKCCTCSSKIAYYAPIFYVLIQTPKLNSKFQRLDAFFDNKISYALDLLVSFNISWMFENSVSEHVLRFFIHSLKLPNKEPYKKLMLQLQPQNCRYFTCIFCSFSNHWTVNCKFFEKYARYNFLYIGYVYCKSGVIFQGFQSYNLKENQRKQFNSFEIIVKFSFLAILYNYIHV